MNPRVDLDRYDALTLGSLLGAAAITLAVYPRLPERVPLHFDLHGVADGFGDRSAVFVLSGVSLGVWLLIRFGAALLPSAWRERLLASPVSALGLVTILLLCAMQLVILHAAIHPERSVGAAIATALGAFWIVLAQILPRVRRNPIIGVRVVWTLASDENWARTHRFAGITMTAGGLVTLIAAALGAPAFGLVAAIASALLPVGYSYFVARSLG